MDGTYTPSYLESHGLPVLELAAFAQREGRRPRPIYTAHKWFARRLGAIFRALLVGATCSPTDQFWDAFYGGADLRSRRVLDPFVGGGTSVVEAQRLGATVFGVDIDPVACSITQLELNAGNLPDLTAALNSLQEEVGSHLKPFHRYSSPDGEEYQIVHHFWVQVVNCRECGNEFHAHPNYQLAYDNKRQWVICKQCGQIEVRHRKHKSFRCGSCGQRTVVAEGVVDYGRATCPICAHREPLIEISRRTETPPVWYPFAVEVLQQPDGGRPVPMAQRAFFAASEDTLAKYQNAAAEYHRRQATHPHTFPNEAISSKNRVDSRLIDYGYRNWTDLFNDRQLLHLSLLVEAINAFDDPIRTALAMAYSDHLTTNCMLTSYAAGWRRLTPLFNVRAFRHVPRPVELNPWVDGSGRGTFPNTIRKLMRARDFEIRPKEPLLAGGFRSVTPRPPRGYPEIKCGTARDLSFLTDESIDIVLTDPPYFDNIAYSELAEFFLPWLKLLGIIARDHNLAEVKAESLIGQRESPETLEEYTSGLSDAFAEVARVLRPSGLVIFSYRHSLPQAWLALANAIAPHPLKPVRVLPVPGEAGIGLHAQEGTGLWDAVFVLRKTGSALRNSGELVLDKNQMAQIEAAVGEWNQQLETSSLPFKDADELTLIRAMTVAEVLSSQTAVIESDDTETLERVLTETY